MDAELRKVVMEFPEVATVVTHVGRNDDGTDPWTPSHVEAGITLRPYSAWPSGGTKQDLVRRMSARLAELPGYEIAISQPIIDGVRDKVFDPHSQLAVRVFGDDMKELRRIGKEVAAVLEKVPGTADVLVDDRPPLPADRRHARPRGGGALRHQCRRHRRSHPDRHRRRRRQPGLRRRAALRHHGAIQGYRPRQSRGARQPRAHVEHRRAGAALAGRADRSCRPARAPSTAT